MSNSMNWLNSRRTALIAMLIAIEVVIAGLGIYLITGGHMPQIGANGMHRAAFTPRAIAPLALGSSPVVTIDDSNSSITVSASSDNLVHVVDRTNVGGTTWASSNIPQLRVTRTANGVDIARPNYDAVTFFNFGSMQQEVDVEVPPQSRVDIVHSSGASVRDLRGDVSVRSDDGAISAQRLQSNTISLSSGDGHLSLADISTNALTAKTSDGHISAKGLAFTGSTPSATIHTSDGSVRVDGSFAGGSYDISTGDGHVDLALSNPSNVTLDASTGDGNIRLNGDSQSSNSDSSQRTLRIGNASGSMHVSSGDGSIHITANGAQ